LKGDNLRIISIALIITSIFSISAKMSLAQETELVLQKGHSENIMSVKFSPDNKLFATGSFDKTVKLWDLSSGKEIRTFSGSTSPVLTIDFSPDGKLIAAYNSEHTMTVWNASTGARFGQLKEIANNDDAIAFSRNWKFFASSSKGNISLWDFKLGNKIKNFKGDSSEIRELKFSNDNSSIISVDSNKKIKIWNIKTGKSVTLPVQNDLISALDFSPDSKYIATGGYDKVLKIWSYSTHKLVKSLKGHYQEIDFISFSPDKKTVASAGTEGIIKLWDINSGKQILNIKDGANYIEALTYSNDGKYLLSSNSSLGFKLWNAKTGKLIYARGPQLEPVYTVTGNDRLIAFSSGNPFVTEPGIIKMWNLSKGSLIRFPTAHSDFVTALEFNPDGEFLASGSRDSKIILWQILDQSVFSTLKGHTSAVNTLNINNDSLFLVSGSHDNNIRVWNLSSGAELLLLGGHTSYLESVQFSPDSQLIASSGLDNTIKIWDVLYGKLINTFNLDVAINSVKFSPNGKTLASGNGDIFAGHKNHSVSLWDIATGKQKSILTGHSGPVNSVAFNRKGSLLASGSSDNTIKLWDPETGKNIKTLNGHTNSVNYVNFGSTGKNNLFSGSRDNSIKIWDLTSGKEIASLYSFADGEYIITTPDNYFAGSLGINKYISFSSGTKVIDTPELFEKYNRPDIVLKRLGYIK
jgi:WD40 repeat protein